MRSRRPGHALITKQVVYTPHPATEKIDHITTGRLPLASKLGITGGESSA